MNEPIFEQSLAQKVLKSVLDHYNFTCKQFAEKLPMKRASMIYSMYNGQTQRISEKYVGYITEAFPELNPDYLRTGRGSMFIDVNETPIKQETDTSKVLLHLISVIQDQTKELQALKDEVKSLKIFVANLQPMPAPKPYNYEERSRVVSDGSTVKNENLK